MMAILRHLNIMLWCMTKGMAYSILITIILSFTCRTYHSIKTNSNNNNTNDTKFS